MYHVLLLSSDTGLQDNWDQQQDSKTEAVYQKIHLLNRLTLLHCCFYFWTAVSIQNDTQCYPMSLPQRLGLQHIYHVLTREQYMWGNRSGVAKQPVQLNKESGNKAVSREKILCDGATSVLTWQTSCEGCNCTPHEKSGRSCCELHVVNFMDFCCLTDGCVPVWIYWLKVWCLFRRIQGLE